MALTNPSVPYVALRDAIITLLKDNYTNLNANLNNEFTAAKLDKQIMPGMPTVKTGLSKGYPYAYVNVMEKSNEEFAGMGGGGRKRADVFFAISIVTRGINRGATIDDDDCYNLSSNIEALFRNNIQFDVRILDSNPNDTKFNTGIKSKGVFVSTAEIGITCKADIA